MGDGLSSSKSFSYKLTDKRFLVSLDWFLRFPIDDLTALETKGTSIKDHLPAVLVSISGSITEFSLIFGALGRFGGQWALKL